MTWRRPCAWFQSRSSLESRRNYDTLTHQPERNDGQTRVFSFHYRDVVDLRANVVRNHGLTKDDNAGFFDASLWESVKRSGPAALKRLINDGLENTSVTCVLIDSESYVRPWVRYELLQSFRRAN